MTNLTSRGITRRVLPLAAAISMIMASGQKREVKPVNAPPKQLLSIPHLQNENYQQENRFVQSLIVDPSSIPKGYAQRLYSLPADKQAEFDAMTAKMYERLKRPGRIPGLKKMPSDPLIYMYLDNDNCVWSIWNIEETIGKKEPAGMAFMVIFSSALVYNAGEKIYQFSLGHEIGHAILRLQPELLDVLLPKDPEVEEELTKRNISDAETIRAFKTELVCDKLAILATRSLIGANGFFMLLEQNKERQILRRVEQIVKDEMRKRGGYPLPKEEREEIHQKRANDANDLFGSYPSNKLRTTLAERYLLEVERNDGIKYPLR